MQSSPTDNTPGKPNRSKPAALVLSGGAALAAAHLGAIQVLEEHGWEFDFFCGVSAGAIVAALLACGENSHSAWQIIKETKKLRLIFEPSTRRGGLIKGDKITQVFKDFFADKEIEDLDYPLFIGATDFESGEQVIISSGKIVDALRASIAVPIIFHPHYHPQLKKLLVDGGLVENLPLLPAFEHYKGKSIVAIDVATTLEPFSPPKGEDIPRATNFTNSLIRTIRIMLKAQQRFLPQDERLTIIRPETGAYSAINIRKMEELYQLGRQAAQKQLNLVVKKV